jgi:hypothetical protein
MTRRGDPEKIYLAQRRDLHAPRVGRTAGQLDAEDWITRWEREAEANGPAVGSQGYWDAAWRWIEVQRKAPGRPRDLARRT